MADITLGDLLQWERGLQYLAPVGEPEGAALNRVVSWAVTMRASPPVLPPLRGGEVVIAPQRVLERVEQTEMIARRDLLARLTGQSIAALVVDRSFEASAVEGLPILVSSILTADFESVLNRLFTERRADLYRLGSDLSRVLSTVMVAGAGLDPLLDAAASVVGRPLVLFGPEGVAVARSGDAPLSLSLPPISDDAGPNTAGPLRVRGDADTTWLAQPVRQTGSRRAYVLAISISPNSSTEIERLILTQTATVVDLMISQTQAGERTSERGSREALVADLLLGRLVSREAAEARLRLLGLDPAQPARVALFVSASGDLPARVRSGLPTDMVRAGSALDGHAYAVIVTADAAFPDRWRDLVAALRSLRSRDETAMLSISEPVESAVHAQVALNEARVTARLMRSGAIDRVVLRADELEHLGIYSLLIPLSSGVDSSPHAVRDRLSRFAGTLLAPVEDQDRRRGSQLIPTLDAYLRSGGALAQAAESLHIHRNTLSYRLARIAELSGRDLADPQTRFLLQVALAIRSLKQASADDD